MNTIRIAFNKIRNSAQDTGILTPPQKRELARLDADLSRLQDEATGENWLEIFELREEIAGITLSDLGMFA